MIRFETTVDSENPIENQNHYRITSIVTLFSCFRIMRVYLEARGHTSSKHLVVNPNQQQTMSLKILN